MLLARILRLLASRHIFYEVSPDVFRNNRVSSSLCTGKSFEEIQEKYGFQPPFISHANRRPGLLKNGITPTGAPLWQKLCAYSRCGVTKSGCLALSWQRDRRCQSCWVLSRESNRPQYFALSRTHPGALTSCIQRQCSVPYMAPSTREYSAAQTDAKRHAFIDRLCTWHFTMGR